MAKKILLIESDAPFARQLGQALEEKGFDVRTTGDGKEGLELVQASRPDAIVLCVELPKMSGYSVCNKLKKDDALKAIPLVVISAEATPETFEQHKKLKTRAEEYLIKPFAPATLLGRLADLVGMPEATGEEEVVTLADVELDALGGVDEGAPDRAKGAAAESPREVPDEDEDLKMLDDAFESISAEPEKQADDAGARKGERAVAEEDLAAATASLPDEAPPGGDMPALGDEADAALEALEASGDEDERLSPAVEPRAAPPIRGASADMLRSAGIPLLEPEPPRPPPAMPAREPAEAGRKGGEPQGEVGRLEKRVGQLTERAERAEEEAERAEAEVKQARTKIDALNATVKRLETDLKALREEARQSAEKAEAAEEELSGLRSRLEEAKRSQAAKAEEAAEATEKAATLEREMESLRAEVAGARSTAEGAGEEIERRAQELRRRVDELEAANRKNEERVVKAYQKIKGDEKLREKTRKALSIALQLLDERAPAPEETEKASVRE